MVEQAAVVTGAAQGIGRAIATRLVAEGLRVVVADLDADALAGVAHATGGTAVPGDCTTADGVQHLLDAAHAALGRIDVFVANAGIDTGDGLDTADEVWDRMLCVNLFGHVRAARTLVPQWITDGKGGRFVVTASAAGLLTMLGNAPYSVSKRTTSRQASGTPWATTGSWSCLIPTCSTTTPPGRPAPTAGWPG